MEQYKKHADGRDDGLTEIDPDSPEAYAEWEKKRGMKKPKMPAPQLHMRLKEQKHYIDACTELDSAAVGCAVRILEGQRRLGDGAHAHVVAGVELQRRNVALAAGKIAVEDGTDVGLAILLGHGHDRTRDAVRLIERQLAVRVARECLGFVRTVSVGHSGLHLRQELEDKELILQRVDAHQYICLHTGSCMRRRDMTPKTAKFASGVRQQISVKLFRRKQKKRRTASKQTILRSVSYSV